MKLTKFLRFYWQVNSDLSTNFTSSRFVQSRSLDDWTSIISPQVGDEKDSTSNKGYAIEFSGN